MQCIRLFRVAGAVSHHLSSGPRGQAAPLSPGRGWLFIVYSVLRVDIGDRTTHTTCRRARSGFKEIRNKCKSGENEASSSTLPLPNQAQPNPTARKAAKARFTYPIQPTPNGGAVGKHPPPSPPPPPRTPNPRHPRTRPDPDSPFLAPDSSETHPLTHLPRRRRGDHEGWGPEGRNKEKLTQLHSHRIGEPHLSCHLCMH